MTTPQPESEGTMMSDSNQADEPPVEPGSSAPPAQGEDDDARDRLVGRYTEVDGEAPLVRGVAGEYTRGNGAADDESVVGDYVSTEEHPHSHDASERPGKYTRADHGETRHPKQHD